MTMPLNLVLIRHGESEGNEAIHLSREGDHSKFEALRKRFSLTWKLTQKGVSQAQAAGVWIRDEFASGFDRHYVSSYDRAIETAINLNLEDAMWYVDDDLRERDRGLMDVVSQLQMDTEYLEEAKLRDLHGYHYRYPGGESMADTRLRVKTTFFGVLARECSEMDVLAVCHGEVIRPIRQIIERWTPQHYMLTQHTGEPESRVRNCEIFHYSRMHPEIPSPPSDRYEWMRRICPWDRDLESERWRNVNVSDRTWSNEDLRRLLTL